MKSLPSFMGHILGGGTKSEAFHCYLELVERWDEEAGGFYECDSYITLPRAEER